MKRHVEQTGVVITTVFANCGDMYIRYQITIQYEAIFVGIREMQMAKVDCGSDNPFIRTEREWLHSCGT